MKKSTPQPPPPGTTRSGEIRHNERGQAVWHWAVDTARNAINSTSQLLRKLDLSELSLEDEQPPAAAVPEAEPVLNPERLKLAPSEARRAARKPGGAAEFNPYKSGKPVAPARPGKRVRPEDARRLGQMPLRPESGAPRPSWWHRLLGRG